MKNEKIYGAMVRLPEGTYFELRKIALEHRSTFNRFAREILERYVENHGERSQKEPTAAA